jgi:DNA-binding XRE family transcriptional regulator
MTMKAKTISLFEAGDLAPTLTTVATLAAALHVRIEDLLRQEGEIAVASPADGEEVALLEDFRAVSETERQAVRTVLRGLARK